MFLDVKKDTVFFLASEFGLGKLCCVQFFFFCCCWPYDMVEDLKLCMVSNAR